MNFQRILLLSKVCVNCNKQLLPAFSSRALNYSQRIDPITSLPTTRDRNYGRELRWYIKLLDKIPFLSVTQSRIKVTGFIAYEAVDKINYSQFFQRFCLQDTFYTWFVITELHVWMLMVRFMAEGKDGREVRNRIVQAMWVDVELRAKKLGSVNPRDTRLRISELAEQLQAALVAYDEGLQSSDTVLAAALWRRMFQYQTVDPESLDILVRYVRRQVRHFDQLSPYDLFGERQYDWLPLDSK